jgi:hypothetical protein
MSQYPVGGQPGFPQPGQQGPSWQVPTAPPVPRKRPGWITVLGVLSIVFASLGLLGVVQNLALGAWMQQRQLPRRGRGPQFMEELQEAAERYRYVSAVTGTILGGLGLAGGIGMLKVRPWGRSLSLAYAVASIVNVCVMVALGGISGPLVLLVMGCAGLLGIAYPIVLLCFLLPSRRAAQYQSFAQG